ncbi:hypothetical protein [Stackebrandtia albiflava]|nr:hypothetical protein [Stackebrandtia albiflava]
MSKVMFAMRNDMPGTLPAEADNPAPRATRLANTTHTGHRSLP